MGWYGGAGARRVAGPIERTGGVQDVPPPDPATGLVECAWRDPFRLETRDASGAWTTGVYLVRLTTPEGRGGLRKQSLIVFVVREDERQAPIVLQSSVTTFAAYNNCGGKSLHGFNSGNAPAPMVSFDRPSASNLYGVRLEALPISRRRWEYNAVRFLEREGYDLSDVTDVDTHQRAVAAGARIFLSVGHDEYWSWQMRSHVEAARDRGVQIRFEPGRSGGADRTIVAYKEAAGDLDSYAIDGLAQEQPPDHRPLARPADVAPERLIGVMYAADL